MVVMILTERDYFLQANPDIYRMLQNDTSLKNIATIEELRNLNLDYIRLPQLFFDSDIAFNTNSFDVSNFMKVLLCMVVNNRLVYDLHYENCHCTEKDVEGLMQVVQTAFEICHSRFIEYFSGILSVKVSTNMRLRGRIVDEIFLTIELTEHYHGALADSFRFLKMCEYVKAELVRNNKIRRNMSQYEIAKVIFNWVVLHVSYDYNFRRYSYTGFSAMAYGYAVCQGYTALYNALCKCFGISIVGMSGKAKNRRTRSTENHIWSFAYLDGRNVYMDVTWGSPNFENENMLRKFGIHPSLLCDFTYFDISYRDLMQDRTWDRQLYG